MEYMGLADASLDLNIRPPIFLDDSLMKQEVRSNFNDVGLEREMAVKEEKGALVEQLNRLNTENQKLTQMLEVMRQNYNALRKQLLEHMTKNLPVAYDPITPPKKRKAEIVIDTAANVHVHDHDMDANYGPSESSSCNEGSCNKAREEHTTAKISRVYVRTEASDASLMVKDGYQWRKYGQKVTKDNPSPRAYFKCSFAPTCPVKKKVQRSIEDKSIIVATYEGEHKHPNPTKLESTALTISNPNPHVRTKIQGRVPCSTSPSASGPATITLDLTKPMFPQEGRDSNGKSAEPPNWLPYFIQQMASSLTSNPTFKSALAAAIRSNRDGEQKTL